jgi:hypothetical protein
VLIRAQWISLGDWLDFYATNPYSAATLGAAASVLATVIVSRFTAPLPQAHIDQLRATH